MGISHHSASPSSEDNESLARLKSLYLPSLAEKSFLNIGCREGFYCGFASFAGARRVVGIDNNDECIKKANISFPACDFRQGGFSQLINEKYDIIIFSIPGDRPCEIESLVKKTLDCLAPKGILILEVSVSPSEASQKITSDSVTRRSTWPNLGQFHELFKVCDAAWKTFGPRPRLKAEDMPTYIFHLSKRIPYAFLLMAPPGSGKSYIANTVLDAQSLRKVRGDAVIVKITQGYYKIRILLRRTIKRKHKEFQGIQSVTEYMLESGMARVIVDTWLQEAALNNNADAKDLLIDSYIPRKYHRQIARILRAKGYMPVILKWKSLIDRQRGGKDFRQEASRYLQSLTKTQNN